MGKDFGQRAIYNLDVTAIKDHLTQKRLLRYGSRRTMLPKNILSQKILLGLDLSDRSDKGFTLIELLVVILMIGILTAISLPAFIRQIGKSRETDAKISLGSIVRAQQAYHFEKGKFASTNDLLAINGTFNSSYYSFSEPASADFNVLAKHQAVANDPFAQGIRNYGAAVYFNSGLFTTFMCQGKEIGEAVEAPDTDSGICSNNGVSVK